MEGVGGGFDGGGISKAVVDVASPEARSEQAEGGHERAAICAEELIDVGSTQLERARTALLLETFQKCKPK